jgi:hypothetical protein
LGILNNNFKPTLVQKFSRIDRSPIRLYGSDPYRKKDKNQLTSIELKFFRRTAGYTLLNTKGMKKFGGLKVASVDEELRG